MLQEKVDKGLDSVPQTKSLPLQLILLGNKLEQKNRILKVLILDIFEFVRLLV